MPLSPIRCTAGPHYFNRFPENQSSGYTTAFHAVGVSYTASVWLRTFMAAASNGLELTIKQSSGLPRSLLNRGLVPEMFENETEFPLFTAWRNHCRQGLDRASKTQSSTLARKSVAMLMAARQSSPEQQRRALWKNSTHGESSQQRHLRCLVAPQLRRSCVSCQNGLPCWVHCRVWHCSKLATGCTTSGVCSWVVF